MATKVRAALSVEAAALEMLLGIKSTKVPPHIKARVAECRRRLAAGERSPAAMQAGLGCTVDELIATLWRSHQEG